MLPHHHSPPRSNLAVDERSILHVLAAEQARAAERALHPPWSARLVARVFGDRLDRALIDGADPTTSATLAARTAVLTSPATRAELADGLDVILASAQTPPSRLRALPRHAALLANASLLRELATRSSMPLISVSAFSALRSCSSWLRVWRYSARIALSACSDTNVAW